MKTLFLAVAIAATSSTGYCAEVIIIRGDSYEERLRAHLKLEAEARAAADAAAKAEDEARYRIWADKDGKMTLDNLGSEKAKFVWFRDEKVIVLTHAQKPPQRFVRFPISVLPQADQHWVREHDKALSKEAAAQKARGGNPFQYWTDKNGERTLPIGNERAKFWDFKDGKARVLSEGDPWTDQRLVSIDMNDLSLADQKWIREQLKKTTEAKKAAAEKKKQKKQRSNPGRR